MLYLYSVLYTLYSVPYPGIYPIPQANVRTFCNKTTRPARPPFSLLPCPFSLLPSPLLHSIPIRTDSTGRNQDILASPYICSGLAGQYVGATSLYTGGWSGETTRASGVIKLRFLRRHEPAFVFDRENGWNLPASTEYTVYIQIRSTECSPPASRCGVA